MPANLISSVVRILKPDGSTAGTGFVVSDQGLIATCSHVVQSEDSQQQGEPRPEFVKLVLHATNERRQARVEPEWWRPANAEDVAILRLQGPLPKQVKPLALGSSDGTSGHRFNSFGFPRVEGTDGLYGYGTIGDQNRVAGHSVIQLSDAMAVTGGFSGAPLMDTVSRYIVGMVSAIVSPDQHMRLLGVAFAIPSDALVSICPELKQVSRPRPVNGAVFLVDFPRNPNFVGRGQDLDGLHTLVSQGDPAAGIRPTVLVGLGGIGKTQLAVEYAHAYRDAYPDGVYWLNAANHLLSEFAKLAKALALADQDTPPEQAARRAWAYLDTRPGALAILDNVVQPARLNIPFATGLIPANLRCRLLFTTRQRDLPSPFQPFEVKVLAERAALHLLLRDRPQVLDEHDPEWSVAHVICASLGWLPLALELAAAYLKTYPQVTLADYLERLRTEGALATLDDTELRPEELPTRHEAAVAATLRMHWNLLEDENARLLFRVAGQFPEATWIPNTWLGLLTGIAPTARRGHPVPLTLALNRLYDVSLIEELTFDRLRLNPLVHEFAQQLTAKEERPDFGQVLENNLIASLQDPDRRRERALPAGECLLNLPWEPTRMRSEVLRALRELVTDIEMPASKRQTSAFLLDRLRWLEDTETVSSDEMLGYLSFVERSIYSRDDWNRIVRLITPLLAQPLAERERAHLLGYRAIFLAQMGDLNEAEKEYRHAQHLFAGLGPTDKRPEDHKLAARIKLGLANILVYQVLSLPEEGREENDAKLQRAVILYHEAAEEAQIYGQDVALTVGIDTELSYALGLLEKWEEAEESYRKALDDLDKVHNPDAWVDRYALILRNAGLIHWAKGNALAEHQQITQALSEFETAYRHAWAEIAILDKLREPKDLAEAHINAGDYLLAASQLSGDPKSQLLLEACAEWKTAYEKAQGLGLEGVDRETYEQWKNSLDSAYRSALEELEHAACERLAQYCPSKAPQKCKEWLREEHDEAPTS